MVQGAVTKEVTSAEELMETFDAGSKNRHVSCTSESATCAHCIHVPYYLYIYIIYVSSNNPFTQSCMYMYNYSASIAIHRSSLL